MRSQFLRTLTTVVVTGVTSVVVGAQKVSFDYDKTADFATLKTFAFREGTRSRNPLVDANVRGAIVMALTDRGMNIDDDNPDAYVVTHLTFDRRKDITAYSTGYGSYAWYWGGGWGTTDVRVRDILTGTLVIDVVDASKGAVIWRGIGVKEVKQQPNPATVETNIQDAVTKILESFPPKNVSSSSQRGLSIRAVPISPGTTGAVPEILPRSS